MSAALLIGRAVFSRNPRPSPLTMASITEVMTKWAAIAQIGEEALVDEMRRFLRQLPDKDVSRCVWVMSLMEAGIFGQAITSKRISGISPIRIRDDPDVFPQDSNRIERREADSGSARRQRNAEEETRVDRFVEVTQVQVGKVEETI